jgi:hypothetical protein
MAAAGVTKWQIQWVIMMKNRLGILIDWSD